MKRIILASLSPRRRELMKRTGLRFSVEESGFEEVLRTKLSPRKAAEYLSCGKAKFAHSRHPDSIVIAADTIVVLRGKIIGKPKDAKDAARILRRLSGKTHSVITGFTIIGAGRRVTKSTETKVTFRRLAGSEIAWYVKTREPLDKAGAYGIQGKGGLLIKEISGDYYNVVGLPISELLVELKKFGVKV